MGIRDQKPHTSYAHSTHWCDFANMCSRGENGEKVEGELLSANMKMRYWRGSKHRLRALVHFSS